MDPVDGLVCASRPERAIAASHELARLTGPQYANSVEALVGAELVKGVDLDVGSTSALVHGFENFEAQSVSETMLAKLDKSTFDIAQATKPRVQQLAPCAGSSDADKRACGKQFITKFAGKAFRRPLTSAESTRWQAFFDDQLGKGGYDLAVGAVIEAVLMAPQFLYRIEEGMPVEGAEDQPIRELTSHELATRLSYFLTDGPPDATLRALADDDALRDTATIRDQALRLIESAAARDVVARFHSQWLKLEDLQDLTRDNVHVSLDASKESALREGMSRFVASVFWDDRGGIPDLFTAPYAFVNASLEPIYQESVEDESLTRVAFDGNRRAGLLTQAGWLAQHAHQDTDSPIFRGHFIAERVLCAPPPPVPDGLMVQFPKEDPNSPPITTRQRTEEIHESVAGCGACHAHFDLYGFPFGHYDNVGRWREHETIRGQDLEVDTKVEITATRDFNGEVDGAYDFSKKLGGSQQVAQCVATQWFRFAYGRTETDADTCALEPVLKAAIAEEGSLQDITLAVVLGDAFRFIPFAD